MGTPKLIRDTASSHRALVSDDCAIMETAKNFLVTKGVDFVVQVLAAIALYILGRWVIRGVRTFVRRALDNAGIR